MSRSFRRGLLVGAALTAAAIVTSVAMALGTLFALAFAEDIDDESED